MAAELRCFLDPECTQEVKMSALGDYILRFAPNAGLNGYTGETHTVLVYIKNTGTRAALHITAHISNDKFEFITLPVTELGDISESEIRKFEILVSIPRWTRYQIQSPYVSFMYYTLPDIDEVYHNPYQDSRIERYPEEEVSNP